MSAWAQGQYLFPGSVENSRKHILNDRGLVKWWCRALNATRNNEISFDNVPDLVTGSLPPDAPLELVSTSRCSDSQQLISTNLAWMDDHPSFMQDKVEV